MPKAAMEEWAKQEDARPPQLDENHLIAKSHRPEQAASSPHPFPIPSHLLAAWTVIETSVACVGSSAAKSLEKSSVVPVLAAARGQLQPS